MRPEARAKIARLLRRLRHVMWLIGFGVPGTRSVRERAAMAAHERFELAEQRALTIVDRFGPLALAQEVGMLVEAVYEHSCRTCAALRATSRDILQIRNELARETLRRRSRDAEVAALRAQLTHERMAHERYVHNLEAFSRREIAAHKQQVTALRAANVELEERRRATAAARSTLQVALELVRARLETL